LEGTETLATGDLAASLGWAPDSILVMVVVVAVLLLLVNAHASMKLSD
jgi:hypothetical protein